MTELTGVVRPYVTRVAQKYLAHASDDALTDSMSVVLLEIHQMAAKNADACYDYLRPRAGVAPVVLSRYVDAQTLRRDLDSTTAVIVTAIADPQPVPAPADITAGRIAVAAQLRAKYTADDLAALSNLNAPTVDHAEYCKMTAAVLEETLAL